MHCARQPPTRVELFRDKLIVTGPIRCSTSLLSLYSKFSRDCNLELYQISWSSSMYVVLVLLRDRGSKPDHNFQSPVWGSSSTSGGLNPFNHLQIEHWTREHREIRDACIHPHPTHCRAKQLCWGGGGPDPWTPGQRGACLEWKRKSEGVMDDERENNRPCASIRLFYFIFSWLTRDSYTALACAI